MNIAVNGCSGFATSTQKGPFMAMLISRSRGTHLIEKHNICIQRASYLSGFINFWQLWVTQWLCFLIAVLRDHARATSIVHICPTRLKPNAQRAYWHTVFVHPFVQWVGTLLWWRVRGEETKGTRLMSCHDSWKCEYHNKCSRNSGTPRLMQESLVALETYLDSNFFCRRYNCWWPW